VHSAAAASFVSLCPLSLDVLQLLIWHLLDRRPVCVFSSSIRIEDRKEFCVFLLKFFPLVYRKQSLLSFFLYLTACVFVGSSFGFKRTLHSCWPCSGGGNYLRAVGTQFFAAVLLGAHTFGQHNQQIVFSVEKRVYFDVFATSRFLCTSV
jgi:hypothetical protein